MLNSFFLLKYQLILYFLLRLNLIVKNNNVFMPKFKIFDRFDIKIK